MKPRVSIIAAVLLLAGAGCPADLKMRLRLPFTFGTVEEKAADEAAGRVVLAPGLAVTLRPTFLGITGTIDDVFGSEKGARTVTVAAVEEGGLTATWTEPLGSGRDASGTFEVSEAAASHAMVLPAFWKTGPQELTGVSALWMSSEAYAELTGDGATEWRLGLGDGLIDVAAAALRAFDSAAGRAAGGTGGPFLARLTSASATFPVRLDGRLEHVRVLHASSWFADYVILKNLSDPLILKVNVNPVALGALQALKILDVDPAAVGYEVTSLEIPE